jgi:hypothetical protein
MIIQSRFSNSLDFNYEINLEYESDTPIVNALKFKIISCGRYYVPACRLYILD